MGNALRPHLPMIWRFALSLSGKPDVADDLTQATCLRVIEKAHQYAEQGKFEGWLLTICKSIWLNELRSSAIRAAGSLESASESDLQSLLPDTETNIFARQVLSKIMLLPEAQRQTVILVYSEGFTYSETAKLLDIPIGTVMSRLHAARKTLAGLNEPVTSGKAVTK